MKLTVPEWNKFWKDLGDEWYIEESTFPDDMPTEGPIEGDGVLLWQGEGHPSEHQNDLLTLREREEGQANFPTVFRRWKKAQSSVTYCVQIPQEKAKEFEALVKTLKGSLLT